MSYPKPLSEKSLFRRYSEAGITEAQVSFLRDFFTACANLYGVILAKEAWDVYKELSTQTETVQLRKKDMYTALGILRRETVPFYVFEVDEVYSDEKRTDNNRIIAIREIVLRGYGKYMPLWSLMSIAKGRSFFVPANFLEYAAMQENEYEEGLLCMLEDLQSVLEEFEDDMGRLHPCKYTGKRLKDFSFMNSNDVFELKCLRGEVPGHKENAEKAAEFEAEVNSINAAQYLVDGLKWRSNIGYASQVESIRYFFKCLNEMGVAFSGDKQVSELLDAVNQMHNNQHLWSNRGWTPNDLAAQYPNMSPPKISFGPELQQAFANGDVDKEELMRKLKVMGIEVLE